ncbi:N-acetylmuramoyl-L-alanine amidase CwlD [Lottiidibacillus patelloidae]|uniref:N-acetylmuramoyl-L-alanine amidase CwlD n=1 Tax=Lottiidibacillus patelloidae TaxID=2670334 RepID=A0A263BQU0_9BACI|nr:N-acetylmuramoyl-L-alanine amidase CwlD [Lottiidibacillus patelloidae]OZM55948.1 N-acetylmuramoyl-L-alanine amidase CwlD [Lottiidibacillus patelloidae]
MRKWIKVAIVSLSVVLLFLLIKNQFLSDFSWSTWNTPLSGKVIILDPGHGGPDGGATSKAGVQEKDIALEICLALRDYLQEAGALVIMTREKDTDLADEGTGRLRHRKNQDLRKRVEVINETGADLYISIHLNAIPSEKWRGAQTFFNPSIEENEILSKFIQHEIRRNLENTNRSAKPISGVYLVSRAKIPGALVEVGFLSNHHESELLKTAQYQRKIAASIYQGILRYSTDEKVPSD